MEKLNKLVDLLDSLADKYKFSEDDKAAIREIVFDLETTGPDAIYGDEYVEDEEEIAEDE